MPQATPPHGIVRQGPRPQRICQNGPSLWRGVRVARIESLLSARLFLQPQVVGDRIFFESNLGGHISLYAMDRGGSVPEPLIPPDLALQNPHLLPGLPYYVFPKLKKIFLSLDRNGDENYQPMSVPID